MKTIYRCLLISLVCLASTTLKADVVKWVDENGQTHYSNKAPDQAQENAETIDFEAYKPPAIIATEVVKAIDWSKDFEIKLLDDEQTQALKAARAAREERRKRLVKLKQKEPTVAELRAACDVARERLIAPARAEAVEACIEKNHRRVSDVEEYCERYYKTYGDERYIKTYWSENPYYYPNNDYRKGYSVIHREKRLYNDIPECARFYQAEKKRKRRNHGYRD